FLSSQGWFTPHSRLIGGEMLNQWKGPLNTFRCTIEPESLKEVEERYFFKVSQIKLEVETLLDREIYDFVETILNRFLGVLMLRKMFIIRKTNLIDVHFYDL